MHADMLDGRPVVIVDPDTSWPEMFEAERVRLSDALVGLVVAIEHYGSTAVPALSAKPVIDILIGLHDLGQADRCQAPLNSLGYLLYPQGCFDGRVAYLRFLVGRLAYNLSVCQYGSAYWNSHLLFRDRLRQDGPLAQDYEQLKRELAAKYRDNRIAYQYFKTDFISSICGQGWIGEPPKLSDER